MMATMALNGGYAVTFSSSGTGWVDSIGAGRSRPNGRYSAQSTSRARDLALVEGEAFLAVARGRPATPAERAQLRDMIDLVSQAVARRGRALSLRVCDTKAFADDDVFWAACHAVAWSGAQLNAVRVARAIRSVERVLRATFG